VFQRKKQSRFIAMKDMLGKELRQPSSAILGKQWRKMVEESSFIIDQVKF